MRKFISKFMFKIAGLIAFVMMMAVVAAINVSVAFTEKGLSDISLANLAALSRTEYAVGDELCCDKTMGGVCQWTCDNCHGMVWASTGYGKGIGVKATCTCCWKDHTHSCF